MENLLIINEIGDMMLLEIINGKLKQMSEQVTAFISSMKHGMPQMEQYDEKKNILFELINSELLDHNEYSNLKAKFVRKYSNASEFVIVLVLLEFVFLHNRHNDVFIPNTTVELHRITRKLRFY